MSCHEQQRAETGAPDLAMGAERYSPITISASVWRHGPAVLEIMQKRNVRWPQFSGPEMSDLIAYLNSRLIPRVGHAKY